MPTTRRQRLFTVIFSLWALLFAQGALAGYACPLTEKAAQVASMFERQLPCAEAMADIGDELQPGLCHAHCQSSQAGADSQGSPAPTPACALLLGPVLTVALAAPAGASGRPVAPDASRMGASDPPLSIRHCCWRI